MKAHERKAISRALDTILECNPRAWDDPNTPYRAVRLAQLRAKRVYDSELEREALAYAKSLLK